MLAGRMMPYPLTLTPLLVRAQTHHKNREIVSRRPSGAIHRTTYGDFATRTRKLVTALRRLGVGPGDRVATLCWNHREHLECYFAAPVMGAVIHTLNLRLHPDDLAYIASHAGDSIVIVDRSLLPLFDRFRARIPALRHVIVVPDIAATDGTASDLLDYEMLLADAEPAFDLPTLDENTGAMICYTSGTTGRPKGVLYSHRSIVLHAMAGCMTAVFGLSDRDVVMPVVPMFHAAAWGLPFQAVLAGSKLVFPGSKLDAASLVDLMVSERVTVGAGVPTIWLPMLDLLDRADPKPDLSALRTTIIGGSAAPSAMIEGFRKRHGIDITHAWGMTEMSPLGTLATVRASLGDLDESRSLAIRSSQGAAVPFVELRHVDESEHVLSWDGETMGELEVRGPWVASAYIGDEDPHRFTADGWFKTGDVVTIDADGYVRITDRSKDVIKSGGEWISSVDIENALMAHPAVLEAAVFAARHPKWMERPVAAVVFKPGMKATDDELATHLAARVHRTWRPDAYVVMDQIPRTSTGKFLKSKLRSDHGGIFETKKG